MKLVIAIIQPEELPYIKEELLKREIYKFTVTNAKGQGKEIPVQEVYRGISHEITLLKKVRLEIAVNNEYVDSVVDAITTVAQKDGDKGRGKIFILPIEECIRIRTGERGKEAIG
ncbi:MAG: P-II family nitrogen regulator [Candidatus Marinimicrobia bacterium]|jgi:nitrogen regulatory protein P-II 1|nr:P-II family nitrogen regulator [Candidatus Neomarinimicrobiota bacterium]MBT6008958.1 P-II family nitrogen regulator [Rhodobacterales bacterium]MBT3937928.1 P-II family nitrogen regulator [Candidatus Neomarinimicrobiota bacterium]MBT3960903.1 P-II family nitrogen regulator [Candidatus Neomarinimicrobiota bacterium]MBT4383168.1 P-II family nitrogen regulator [Candidatus Neomarinimicrobiota bacterium]